MYCFPVNKTIIITIHIQWVCLTLIYYSIEIQILTFPDGHYPAIW